jgi:hypothetical protein
MAHIDMPSQTDTNGRSIFVVSEEVDPNYIVKSNGAGLDLRYTDESAIHAGEREYEAYIL